MNTHLNVPFINLAIDWAAGQGVTVDTHEKMEWAIRTYLFEASFKN